MKDNGQGIAGIAPSVKPLQVRVLDASGSGTEAQVADGFDHAGDQGVLIVNASRARPRLLPGDQRRDLHPSTVYALLLDGWNDHELGDDNDTTPTYPCVLPLANVLWRGRQRRGLPAALGSSYGRRQSWTWSSPGRDDRLRLERLDLPDRNMMSMASRRWRPPRRWCCR